jgi:DNA-binding MarR family transcriptional regulator
MEDFIESQGIPLLAHLLRRLSDEYVTATVTFYPQVGVTAPSRTASTLQLLQQQGPKSVTEIGSILRQSHPLVITWVRQLERLGFVSTRTDPQDRRRNVVQLTDNGMAEAKRMKNALIMLGKAYEELMIDADADVFGALWRLEHAGRKTPFITRLVKQAAKRKGKAPL